MAGESKAKRLGARRESRSTRVLSGVAIVGLIATGTVALHARAAFDDPRAATPPLPVLTTEVRLEPGYTLVDRFAGRLEPARETSAAFERAGLLTEVLVDEGDRVAAEQIIAKLDVEPLLARRDGLVAEKKRREAELELARLTAKRQKTLARKGHSSQQRYDEARLGATALEATIAEIDASIRQLDIDIDKSEVRAPFAGVVTDRFSDEGRVVDAGIAVVHLIEADAAQVRIGLSPTAASNLSLGQSVQLTGGGIAMTARVVALRPDLATGTRTVPVLFALDRVPPLPYGEIVELAVPRRTDQTGAWLPLTALVEGPKGLWVVTTVLDSDAGPVTGREAVEVLHVERGQAFVRGTLADGQRVVAGGGNRTVPGQRVALLDRE